MNEAGLTQAQLVELQEVLSALRGDLERVRDQTRAEAGPVAPDDAIGRLSRMDAMQQAQMAKANEAAAGVRLELVKRALAGLEDPEFGLCRSCEEPIEWSRLRARPEAPRCLRCQSAKERG